MYRWIYLLMLVAAPPLLGGLIGTLLARRYDIAGRFAAIILAILILAGGVETEIHWSRIEVQTPNGDHGVSMMISIGTGLVVLFLFYVGLKPNKPSSG
jgi:hypothetical protein